MGALYTLPNHPTIKRRGELQSIVQQLAIKQSRTILIQQQAHSQGGAVGADAPPSQIKGPLF